MNTSAAPYLLRHCGGFWYEVINRYGTVLNNRITHEEACAFITLLNRIDARAAR